MNKSQPFDIFLSEQQESSFTQLDYPKSVQFILQNVTALSLQYNKK